MSKVIPISAHAAHNRLLQALRETVQQLTPERVADAFLYSLSTRALEYRAALGSYWYAVSIPDHAPTESWHCYLCGWSNNSAPGYGKEPDQMMYALSEVAPPKGTTAKEALLKALRELSPNSGIPDYTRVHTSPQQCLTVLRHFLTLPPVRHTEADEVLLQRILQCVYALEPHQRGRVLQKTITKSRIIKSNAYEIDTLLNALGICGVLSSDRAPCYAVEFPNEYQRSPETDSDLLYPLNWWRACDGINRERYEIVFGKPYPGPILPVQEVLSE